jgi:hypothetical protein
MMKSKRMFLLGLASSLLVLIGGLVSNCACIVFLYQPRTPKAFRNK